MHVFPSARTDCFLSDVPARDNTDLKNCREQSVVIMSTAGQNVNVGAQGVTSRQTDNVMQPAAAPMTSTCVTAADSENMAETEERMIQRQEARRERLKSRTTRCMIQTAKEKSGPPAGEKEQIQRERADPQRVKEHSQLQARERATPNAGNVDDTSGDAHTQRCVPGRDQVPHCRGARGIDSHISDARVAAETQLAQFSNKVASWTHRSL